MDTISAWFAAVLAALAGVFFPAGDEARYYGYAEGKYVYVAPDSGGIIEEIAVADGDSVGAGALLFILESDRAQEAVTAAKAALAAAQANLEDLKSGSRPEEIAVIQEQWKSALDSQQLARETFDRTEALSRSQTVPASKLDADRAALNMARAEVARIEAQLKVARLPARDARIEAAEQEVSRAAAELARAEIDFARRKVSAPAAGYVDRVFLDPGEYAAPGTPVVSLLPPDAIKIVFFVPEPVRPQVHAGDRVLVSCSSCAADLPGTVTYLASEAEHTPPVIYSRDERSKLVFAVEARLADPGALQPGQPVDVRFAP